MRVGVDLLFLIPGETGGRETYARELVGAMFECEPDIDVTAFVNREAAGGLSRELSHNMRVVRLPVSARRREQWAAGELACLPVAGARARVDVLHSLANFGPASGRFRRVITVHDLQYRSLPELLPRARRIGTAALLEVAARRADRIITGSRASRDQLLTELKLESGRIDVIPYGLGTSGRATATSEADLRARHRLDARPIALTVATNLPHKNLDGLLEGLALIPPDRRPLLVAVGFNTDSPSLAMRAREAGLEGDVRLLGFQPADALEGLYRMASCVVVPSLYEGFGLPVLEAMVRRVPVACSDIPALNEVAGDAALRFPPRRPAAIAAVLERLMDDRALALRLSKAGRERAAGFSWKTNAAATLASYRRALAPRSGALP